MNKLDIVVLAALLAAMAYFASLYYPEETRSFVNSDMARIFAIILAVAAFAIFLLDYFLKVFSKAAEKP
jgi:hypothetical protein